MYAFLCLGHLSCHCSIWMNSYCTFCVSFALLDIPSAIPTKMHVFLVSRNIRKSLKRLRLGKTTSWQHRFFDLTILSPIWLCTYEYMKNTLENFFFSVWNRASRVDFSDLVKKFQNRPFFVYMKKSLFRAFWGPAKVSRPLDITKVGSESEKAPKNWNGRSSQPNLRNVNFRTS